MSSGELIVVLVFAVLFAGVGYWLSEIDRRRFGRTPWGLPSGVWALFWFISLLLGLILYLIAHADAVRRARQLPGGRFPVTGPYGPGSLGSAPPGVGGAVPPSAPSPADQFPAYPRPANGQPEAPLVGATGPSPTEPVLPPGFRGFPAFPGAPGTPETPDVADPRPVWGREAAADEKSPEDNTTRLPEATVSASGSAVSPPGWHPDPGGRFHYRWWDGSQWTSYVSFNGQQLIDTSPDQRIGPY